jgi:SAM-dependent methyltransferase
MASFAELIAEALAQPFSGWDFSILQGRWFENSPPWVYRRRARQAVANAGTLLDMGTGGGEFLASLAPLPKLAYATEAYPPNIPIARERLEPLGVQVIPIETDEHLPFEAEFFDTIINRHEMFIAQEVARILKPGGRFLTQQVGERNLQELNQCLLGEKSTPRSSRLQKALNYLRAAGMQVLESGEAFPETFFYDVGAVVYLLKAIPWQVRDFSVEKYRPRLLSLHEHIQKHGSFIARNHRYFIQARKPMGE